MRTSIIYLILVFLSSIHQFPGWAQENKGIIIEFSEEDELFISALSAVALKNYEKFDYWISKDNIVELPDNSFIKSRFKDSNENNLVNFYDKMINKIFTEGEKLGVDWTNYKYDKTIFWREKNYELNGLYEIIGNIYFSSNHKTYKIFFKRVIELDHHFLNIYLNDITEIDRIPDSNPIINDKGLENFIFSLAENISIIQSEKDLEKFKLKLDKVVFKNKIENVIGDMINYFVKNGIENKSINEREQIKYDIKTLFNIYNLKNKELIKELNPALIIVYANGEFKDSKVEDEGAIFQILDGIPDKSPFNCTFIEYKGKWYLFPPLSELEKKY